MKLEIDLRDSISNSKLFTGIRGTAMTQLLGKSKQVKFPTGQFVITEGELGETFYWISKGKVEIQMKSESGFVAINTLGKGDVLGELALFGIAPRSASALVTEDLEVYQWNIKDCQVLFSEQPAIGYQLLLNLGNMVSQRLTALNIEFKNRSQFDIKVLQNMG